MYLLFTYIQALKKWLETVIQELLTRETLTVKKRMASAVVLMCCVNRLSSVYIARELVVALLGMMALSPDDATGYEFLRNLMKKRESEYVNQGLFPPKNLILTCIVLYNDPLVGYWSDHH